MTPLPCTIVFTLALKVSVQSRCSGPLLQADRFVAPPGWTNDAVLRSAHTSANFLASTPQLFVGFSAGVRHVGLTASDLEAPRVLNITPTPSLVLSTMIIGCFILLARRKTLSNLSGRGTSLLKYAIA